MFLSDGKYQEQIDYPMHIDVPDEQSPRRSFFMSSVTAGLTNGCRHKMNGICPLRFASLVAHIPPVSTDRKHHTITVPSSTADQYTINDQLLLGSCWKSGVMNVTYHKH